jgi:glycosyltransferase involved in cell wall biosynthesis
MSTEAKTLSILVVISPMYRTMPALLHLLRILKTLKYQVILMAGSLDPKEYGAEVKCIRALTKFTRSNILLNKIIVYILSNFIYIHKLIIYRKEINIVLIFQSESIFTCFFGRLLRKKVITYFGGLGYLNLISKPSLINKLLGLVYFSFEFLTAMLSNRILVISQSLSRRSFLHKFVKKTFVAPLLFIDETLWSEFKMTKPYDFRNEILGFVGRLEYEKGFDFFLKVVMQALARRPKLRIIIIGDGSLAPLAKKMAKKDNRITYLGWLGRNKLPSYLNDMKLLFLPSITEGAPFIVYEAMACGTPVVMTYFEGVEKIIKNGVNGYLVLNRDPTQVCKFLLRLLFSKNELKKISSNCSREFTRFREITSIKTLYSWHEAMNV